jgi:hypothetical protein
LKLKLVAVTANQPHIAKSVVAKLPELGFETLFSDEIVKTITQKRMIKIQGFENSNHGMALRPM